MPEFLNPEGRATPRCSAISLCRYTRAAALERERLLRQWKFIHGASAKRYNLAEGALAEALKHPSTEWTDRLQISASKLRIRPSRSEYWRHAQNSSAAALETLSRELRDARLRGLVVQPGSPQTAKLPLQGVSISVRPEITLRGEDRRGPFIGAVKLYFGQSDALNRYVAESASLLLERYLHSFLSDDDTRVSLRHCWTLDVFRDTWFARPGGHKRRFRELEQCCLEIANRWPFIATAA